MNHFLYVVVHVSQPAQKGPLSQSHIGVYWFLGVGLWTK